MIHNGNSSLRESRRTNHDFVSKVVKDFIARKGGEYLNLELCGGWESPKNCSRRSSCQWKGEGGRVDKDDQGSSTTPLRTEAKRHRIRHRFLMTLTTHWVC